jgi:hypothetical protein
MIEYTKSDDPNAMTELIFRDLRVMVMWVEDAALTDDESFYEIIELPSGKETIIAVSKSHLINMMEEHSNPFMGGFVTGMMLCSVMNETMQELKESAGYNV